jgi:selenide,water dikinase
MSFFDVVLVGGGHSHVQVIKDWSKSLQALSFPQNTFPSPPKICLISESSLAIYSGMLPGVVSGFYAQSEAEISLAPLCEHFGVTFIEGKVEDVEGGRVLVKRSGVGCGASEWVAAKVVSLDVGSMTLGAVGDVERFSIPTRPISVLTARVDNRLKELMASGTASPRLVVVGGGVAGIEISFSLAAKNRAAGNTTPVVVVDAGPSLLKGSTELTRSIIKKAMEEHRIVHMPGKRALAVSAGGDLTLQDVVTEAVEPLHYDILVWAGGARPHDFMAMAPASDARPERDARGFLKVADTLQSVTHPSVFGAGDCVTMVEQPEGFPPKAGVYAVRQGPILTRNILRYLAGGNSGDLLERYAPQKEFLSLINLSDGTAIGSKHGIAFAGEWVMDMKDWIDREFMNLFKVGHVAKGGRSPVESPEDDVVQDPKRAAEALKRGPAERGTGFATQWAILGRMAKDEHYTAQVVEWVVQTMV